MYKDIHSFTGRSAELYGDRTAFQIRRFLGTERYSYREVQHVSALIASFLLSHGISKGDTILVWAPNMPEWSLVLLGALQAGVVTVPVSIHSTNSIVEKYIAQCKPKALFLSKYVPVDYIAKPSSGMQVYFIEEIARTVKDTPLAPLPEIVPDDLAEIVFTSGTTGNPKGVMITHGNILHAAWGLCTANRLKPGAGALSILPLSHIMEQTIGLFAMMHYGATIYYLQKINALTIKHALSKYHVDYLVVVPQIMKMLADAVLLAAETQHSSDKLQRALEIARFLPFPLRRILFHSVLKQMGGKLCTFITGSAPVQINVARMWESMGVQVIEGYGASETTGAATSNTLTRHLLGTVGKPLDGVDIKIVDGQILVRGPTVTPGYYLDPSKTADAFDPDGYYKTGDMASMDASGRVSIHGRSDFKIITASGDKIFPEDIERALNAHPDVEDCCVVGVPDPTGTGQITHASVLLKKHTSTPLPDIIRESNKRLEPHEQILEFSAWKTGDFPRNQTLKIDRKAVRQTIVNIQEAGHDSPIGPAGEPDDLLKRIVSRVCQIPTSAISENSVLVRDFHLDSLKRVELVSLLEQELAVPISETDITPDTTIAQIRQRTTHPVKSTPAQAPPVWPLGNAFVFIRECLRMVFLFPVQNYYVSRITLVHPERLDSFPSPAILVFNHVAHHDSTLIIRILPRKIRMKQVALADAELFRIPWKRWFLYVFGNAYPVDKHGGPVKASLEFVADRLEDGWVLLLSPEGKISDDGQIGKLREGTGLLAVETGVPVIPFKIEGYRELFTEFYKGLLWLPQRRGKVTITVGEPITFPKGTPYDKATERIQQTMMNL